MHEVTINIYFDLAQTQQHFQTIVQLPHARPTMSCIRLVIKYDVLHTHKLRSGSNDNDILTYLASILFNKHEWLDFECMHFLPA